MSRRSAIHRFAMLAPALALAIPAPALAQCPTTDQVGKTILDVLKRPGIAVKKIVPAALKGLCEVQITFQGRPNVIYTDAAGAYLLTGHLLDAKTGKDLTEETLSALNTLSPEDMAKVDALVAMTVGTKGKPLYFVTDPQ